ncbi:hypothetical protein IAE57_10920 [Stenotrophomonas sp. S48]|uniref:hypothetical protein n=1 Tax=unclassified Stenotrophomonas TaxID=196198 RepID=UPI0018FF27C9|nr:MULTISPECIES: hypothetical protein [unclassified Stenotrophomonas]MBK0026674.1 hypothetical protein [Stenotrophomonas sp. S48]MBK0049498.1 hypothetical protein [Stenotrophomonas sp. S49]
MKRNCRHVIALVMCVGASALPSAYAQNVTPATDPVVQIFAEKEGLTAEEADRRLRLRMAAGEALQKIMEVMPDRFAGKTFTENPMVVTVRLTGADPVPSRIVDTRYGRVTYHFVVGAAHSLNELQNVVGSGKIQALFPEHQGIMVDGERGVIVVELPEKDFDNSYESEALDVRRMFSVPIELKKAAAPVTPLSVRNAIHATRG